jgi:glycosyltransferase involved in cell wall biosynthesis
MKILLINKYHYLKGGAERAYFDMARILTAQGHEVAFFSMQHPENRATPWEKYFVENIEYQDVKLSLAERFSLAGKILFNFDAARKLAMLLDDFHPDIAHVHNIYHQLTPSIFWPLKKRNIPIVMTLHDYKLISPNYNLFVRGRIWEHSSAFRCLLDRCVKDSFLKSLVCVLEKWIHTALGSYKKVDVFVAPSRFLIAKYKAMGFTPEIVLLPNPLAPRTSTLQRAEREKNTFLFFGRLSPEKGVDTAIEALALLGEEKKLWIVGDGPDRQRLEELATAKGISSRVTFFGSLYGDELEAVKQRAEAIILPSRWYENFPYTLSESLQSGCVVVAANIGGMTERITDRVNGLLFRASDAGSLADALLSLESLPLDTIRNQASASVADLTEEAFASQLIPIYAALVAHARSVEKEQ